MGINFKKTTKGQVGDIIYPAYNDTNGFLQTNRWDLIVEVDKDNNIIAVRYIWDCATVRAIELMQEIYHLKFKKRK